MMLLKSSEHRGLALIPFYLCHPIALYSPLFSPFDLISPLKPISPTDSLSSLSWDRTQVAYTHQSKQGQVFAFRRSEPLWWWSMLQSCTPLRSYMVRPALFSPIASLSTRRPFGMLVALVGVVIFMLWEFSLPFNSLTSLSAGTISNWDDASPVRVWQQIRQQENVQGAKLEQQDQQPLQDQQQEHLDVSIAQNDPLAYRKKLETRFAGYNYTLGSSRTSTFDSIYTLSLAGQTKRQEQMHRIADALGFKFKIFEATSMRLPKIAWIAERVKEIRDKKRDIIGSALKRPAESIGGMGADSIWFQEEDFSKDIAFPDLSLHDKRWIVDGTAHNWTDYLWMQESRGKDPQPSNQSIDIVKLLWDPVEPEAFRQHSPPIIATWHSHTSMWRHMLDRGEKTALFLEDDVDFEWDFERLWLNALRVLPQDWEIVFLGHCWARTRNST